MAAECKILDWGQHRLICVDDKHIEACMDEVRKGVADGVVISPAMGYQLPEINFLREHSYLKGVVFPDASNIDISFLQCLTDLEYLSVAGSTQPLDLSHFSSLRETWLEWHRGIRLPNMAFSLRVLALHKFRPESGNLMQLPPLPKLENLSIIDTSIVTLEGIEKYEALWRIEVSYAKKLESIKALSALSDKGVKCLECQRCSSIRDYDTLEKMLSLETLHLNSCAIIPSLSFISDMKSLRELRFIGTNVADGNMSPLMAHKELRTVSFTAKRHFSILPREIQAELNQRHKDGRKTG